MQRLVGQHHGSCAPASKRERGLLNKGCSAAGRAEHAGGCCLHCFPRGRRCYASCCCASLLHSGRYSTNPADCQPSVCLVYHCAPLQLDVLNQWINILQSVQLPFAVIPVSSAAS